LGYDKHAKAISTQQCRFLSVLNGRRTNGAVSCRELWSNRFFVCRANLSVQQAVLSDGVALDPVPFQYGYVPAQH